MTPPIHDLAGPRASAESSAGPRRSDATDHLRRVSTDTTATTFSSSTDASLTTAESTPASFQTASMGHGMSFDGPIVGRNSLSDGVYTDDGRQEELAVEENEAETLLATPRPGHAKLTPTQRTTGAMDMPPTIPDTDRLYPGDADEAAFAAYAATTGRPLTRSMTLEEAERATRTLEQEKDAFASTEGSAFSSSGHSSQHPHASVSSSPQKQQGRAPLQTLFADHTPPNEGGAEGHAPQPPSEAAHAPYTYHPYPHSSPHSPPQSPQSAHTPFIPYTTNSHAHAPYTSPHYEESSATISNGVSNMDASTYCASDFGRSRTRLSGTPGMGAFGALNGNSTRTFQNEDAILAEEEKDTLAQFEDRADIEEPGPGLGFSSALLNLPPPPPFDLRVESLTVGVPVVRFERLVNLMQGDILGALKKPVPKEHRKTEILTDVSCDCSSGEVLAILGGSGSGKTTLLNAVAHRLNDLPVKDGGVAYVDSRGEALSHKAAKRRIGFVRQQDYLVECLTVRGTLTYAARLRLPASLSSEAIKVIVEQTLDELGLRDAADTVVGGPLRKGISGGEKRRLSIGCVLVTLPSVLILDEPTSGLDAFTSYLLLQTLSNLARRGRTVILSIHAPRSDAFNLFDRITLLSKGRVVYSGLRGQCLSWFQGQGYELEQGVNPLDFLIDISSIDNRSPDDEEASRARVGKLIDSWSEHVRSQAVGRRGLTSESGVASSRFSSGFWSSTFLEKIEEKKAKRASKRASALAARPPPPGRDPAMHAELTRVSSNIQDQKRPGFWLQTRVLTARAHRNVYRNVPQLIGLALQGIILGVIVGVTYVKLPETPTGIQSLKNVSFQLVPSVFYLQQVFWIYKFCKDLIIFDREREDNLYSVVPYVLSDWISFLLPAIFGPTMYVILVYFIAQFRMDDIAARLFTVIASTILVQCTTQGLALFSSAVTRSFAQASLIGNAINIFQILSAGFMIVNPPNYAEWIRWLSPYFYSFRIVATTVFKDRTFECANWPTGGGANLEQCYGNNVLRGFNFDLDINIGAWFGGLAAFAIFEYALSCLILSVYSAGGVRHAREIDSHDRGKTAEVNQSHMQRSRIDVEVRNLSLVWERRKPAKASSKVILDDVSAFFPAGQVSAILGPSGAGKSTLLQLLASRKLRAGAMAGFHRQGDILFAGAAVNTLTQSNVAFVEQEDDWHLPSLTVRETLRYAAILRLPSDMPRKQKIARAETVLRMLGLKDCADLPVGGALVKGISGGEKRRLSLAVQMINDPAVLLVDEPTSGLDSSIALSVMQALSDIASTGRTVIATIHQPRSDIWKLADNVTLLAKGGVVAFSGKRADAVPYFSAIGWPMPSEFFNPADHLLDLVSVDPRPATYEASLQRVRDLIASWRSSELSQKEMGSEPSEASEKVSSGSDTTPMRIALPVTLSRHFKNLIRQPDVFLSRLLQAPFVGALFILFYQRLTDGPEGAQNRIGITIQSTTALVFVGLLTSMSVYPAERNLYLHEYRSSARYSPATFVATYTLVEVPSEVIACLGYAAIMNVAVGMQTSVRIYFEYFACIWALVNMGESLSILVASWIDSEGLTVTIMSTFVSLVSQISGIISLNVPRWLAAIAWATPMKAATKVEVINECIGLKFRCTTQDLIDGKCIAPTGEALLALFNWADLRTSRFVGIMIAIAVAWRIAAYASVAARVWGTR